MTIKKLSLKGAFFVWFRSYLITFGFKSLPSDAHFTFSFPPDSDDANIHITRELSDRNKKPYIKILVFNKRLAEQALEDFATQFFFLVYKPIIFKRQLLPKTGYREATKYLSFDQVEKYNNGIFKADLKNVFHRSSKHNHKGRLEIKPDIMHNLNKWARSPQHKQIIKDLLKPLTRELSPVIEFGFLSSANFKGAVIRAGSQFYHQREDVDIMKLLSHLLGNELMSAVMEKTQIAIAQVSVAESYSDTEFLSAPVRLF